MARISFVFGSDILKKIKLTLEKRCVISVFYVSGKECIKLIKYDSEYNAI